MNRDIVHEARMHERLTTRRDVVRYLGAAPLAGLAACGGASSQTDVLTFWTVQLSPQFDDFVHAMLTAFEASRPGCKVRWIDVPWSDVERKLLAAVAAGTAPDLVNLNPQFAARLAQAGALVDPSRYVTPEERASYLPPAWDGNRFRDKLFALPWYLSTPITIVNRALFAAAELAVPTRMTEVPKVAVEMRRRTAKYAYYPSLDSSRPLEDMVLLGARLLNTDQTSAGFDTPAGRRAFAFYRDLYQSGAVPRDVLIEGHQKSIDLFQSGQLAMLVTGMETLETIRLNAPSLWRDVDVAPQLAGARVPPSIAAMNLAVPKSARDKEAAFALAKFVTGAAWQSRLAMRAPVLPSTIASFTKAPFGAPSQRTSVLARARTLSVAQLRNGAVLVPTLPNYNKLRTSLQRGIESAMIGTLTVDEAVRQAARAWNALLTHGSGTL